MKKIIIVFIVLFSMIINAEIVNDIQKENTTKTKNDFIFAQLTFQKGDIIGSNDIKQSIINLKKTSIFGEVKIEAFKIDSGLFESVDNNTLNVENTDDTILIKLTTKETLTFLPVIGFAKDNNGYTFTFGLSYSNLWFIRHVVSLYFTFGSYKEFGFEYSIPSLYSRKYNTRLKLSMQQKNRKDLDIIEYHKNALLGAGYSTLPDFSPELFIGYDRVNFDNDTFSLSYLSNSTVNYDEFIISGLNLTYDKRDDIVYPGNGFYISSSFTHNYGFNDVNIKRWLEKFDIRIYKKFLYGVFAMRHLLYLQNGTLAYYNLLEPEAFENRCVNSKDLIANNRYSGTFEYRYKIPFFEKTMDMPLFGSTIIGVMIVAFSDWSYINNSIDNFKIDDFQNYLLGVGSGLRIYSNIFNTLGLDVGYNLNTKALKYNILVFQWNF